MITTYTSPNDVKLAARTALAHKLYVSGWLLSYTLKRAIRYPSRYAITLAHHEGKPIAVCTVHKTSGETMVFVRKTFRNQKFGTKTLEAALRATPDVNHYASPSPVKGSEELFEGRVDILRAD